MIIYKQDINFTGTKEDLQAILSDYRDQLDTWRTSEGVPKPLPEYPILDDLINLDDFELKCKEEEQQQQSEEAQKQSEELHKNKCNPTHEDYDYAYARQNADDGYGTWEDQLDMQYHGTWESHIKEVKERYPKNDNG